MENQGNNNTHLLKEIPLTLTISKQLKTTPNTKFFIYIPNYTEIELSQGKNFENGFWSLTQKLFKTTSFIIKNNLTFFQFLLIHKNNSEEEIVSNVYYKNKEFITGPFITADYTIINKTTINLRIKSITNTQYVKFEIEGIPTNSTLSKGEEIDNNLWEIENKDSKNIMLSLPDNLQTEKLNLSITGINKTQPYYNTTFNLIINLKDNIKPHKTKYKEITIPTLKILKDSKLKFDKYLLTIKNVPENCCIHDGVKIENKWIVKNNHEKIKIRNFDTNINEVNITLEYILLNKDIPTIDNQYSKKIKCDFTDAEIKTKNYTKCLICKNYKKCNLFKDFMNYIGDSTILRHIIHK